ncbi:MAG: hypothetical protein EZS28_048171, partial [Streblomastix strix]
CIFQNIEISSKGGNAIRILNSGSYPITSSIKGCQFNNISSIGDSNGLGGSAIYMESKHGSKLIIEESSQFYQCIIDQGNGGAIYIDIDFSSEFLFKINDTLIQECIAKENTSSNSPTGYGGGIFLTGSGDYDPSSKRLDLKGMKIIRNVAEISGQSLFVAISKVAEWCRTGTAGEYVKGNYSDGISDSNELEGIPVDSTTFNSYSSLQIKNYPLDSTQLSSILIRSEGEFNITGKVRFFLINFIMEGPTLQQDSDSTGLQIHYYGIYGLSQSSEIDLQDCEFHMQDGELQIGKCFIYLEKGGNHAISNLKSKDISSEEN